MCPVLLSYNKSSFAGVDILQPKIAILIKKSLVYIKKVTFLNQNMQFHESCDLQQKVGNLIFFK